MQAPADQIAKFEAQYPNQPNRAILAAMMYGVDVSLKSIAVAMDERKLWQDTIIVVISDNGGVPAPADIIDGSTWARRSAARAALMHSNFPLR